MKNDITYEYRVFTNRRIDVESMEVGTCTSKVINELKPKDKVNGRFFHTSDTDEWFFCWNGELQKLNLKGNSDVNDALAEVEKLIADAKVAVDDAKKTASEAKTAAADAQTAADAAMSAVESIENKADKSDVENLAKVVEDKADASSVEALSAKVDGIKVPSLDGYATEDFVGKAISAIDIPTVPTKTSDLTNDSGFITINDVPEVAVPTKTSDLTNDSGFITINEVAVPTKTSDLTNDSGFITLSDVPEVTIPTNVSEFVNDAKYLTLEEASSKFAPIGSEGGDMDGYATEGYVDAAIALKQDKIDDLDTIRTGAAAGTTALQSIPTNISQLNNDAGYLTEHQDISGKQDKIDDLDAIRSGAAAGTTALQSQALDNYYTKEDINNLIGVAIEKTNTILA